jgi:hypothetical protein
MRHKQLQCWLTASALILAAGPSSLAQTITGSINGNVTDSSGAVVGGATVIAKNVATGVETRTTTNPSGDYNLRFLQVGRYTVTIQRKGFSAQQVGPITLEVDQAAKVDGKLAIGEATQTVQVSSDFQPLLNTDNSTVKSAFDAKTIENLPLNGRNFSSVTQFIPGAVATQPSQMTGVNAIERDTNAGGQVSVNGNRNQANNYLLDGVEINEPVSNVIGYNPSPDAIGNLSVITSNADAEYGNANGGDVIALLKSGTNHYHGSVFGFLENENLDANTWANNHTGTPRQPFTQSVFGGTVGGPILKNKLFFFADYEGIRFNEGGQQTASVLTQAMRQGDFSAVPAQLYHFVPGQGQVAYVNNQVPILSPAAQFLFAHPELYPLPNKAAVNDPSGVQSNYIGSFKQQVRTDQGDIKIDATLSSHDNIMARYSQSDAGDTNVAPLAITFPTNSTYPFKGVAINWVHTFSPNIVNEVRAGYSRVRWSQGVPTDPTGAFGLNGNSLLGIGATQPYPGFAALAFNGNNTGTTDKPTTIGTTGLASSLIDNIFTYGDNLTIEHGQQTWKMGVELVRYQENNFYPGNEGVMGQFGYSGNFTSGPGSAGSSIADFVLNDAISADVAQLVGRTGQRQYRDAAFFQDDYRLKPNFTVNLGLRYEYDQPMYEVNNKEANLDLATGQIYLAGAPGASTVFGDGNALYHPVYTNFEPRIGFSWQPQQRIVFRGGYGITNYFEGTGANLRLNFNPPFQNAFDAKALTPTQTSGGTPLTVQSGFGGSDAAAAPITTYRAWDSHIKPALIQEFTFSNEIQLSNQTSLSMAYLGQLGQHLVNPRAANQIQQGTTVAPYAALVGQSGQVVETQSEAISKYNALQIQVRHREHNGFEYTVNYTWAHALTNNPGFFGTSDVNGAGVYWQDAYNGRADYGNAGFDIRHNLSATGVYELPFGRGRRFGGNVNRWVDEAAGGWKLTGDAIVYSGLPVTINGPNNTNLFNQAERANQYRPLTIHNRSVNNWFGTDPSATPCQNLGNTGDNPQCAYGAAGVGQFGTAAVDTERAPGYEQIDLAVGKTFAITEGQNLEFRADLFNAFNIASYDNPDNNIADQPGFGQIVQTRSNPRIIQFSLHYGF